MSANNSTVPDFRAVEVNTLALNIINEFAVDHEPMLVELALSSLLFGVLTILSVTSVYILLRQGSTARKYALLLTTILLYMITGMYMATLIWNWSSRRELVSRASDGLFSRSYDGGKEKAASRQAVHTQAWMLMYALGMNVIIGDAIVWWRLCVIWPNKFVYCVGPLLLILTSAQESRSMRDMEAGLVLLILDNGFSGAVSILSLATNLLATSLIAYKAWEHRRLVKEHFAAAGTKSQVLQALTLLIESGSIYAVFVIFIAVYQMYLASSQTAFGQAFDRVATDIILGCLVPFVAIYPATIIVLVALKRSAIDNGGLSRVVEAHRAHRANSDGITSTVVFHSSTFGSSGEVGTRVGNPL